MSRNFIYLDNAATTPMYKEAADKMYEVMNECYGNPSAVYSLASKSKKILMDARRTIAATLNAKPEEIFFTSGGTESDNWALSGTAEALSGKGRHIITLNTEHHAILNTTKHLEKLGVKITYLKVDQQGFADVSNLKRVITPDTILISAALANNEIGTIQPVKELAALAHERGILFHTDAVQAYGHIPIDVKAMGIDMLSASAHKFGGPKGVGFLYIKAGLEIANLIYGGGQERNHRSGTENVPGIAAMAVAAELSTSTINERIESEGKLRDYLVKRITNELPLVTLNGPKPDPEKLTRLPNNASLLFKYADSESIVIMMDMAGIAVSGGSACSSGSVDPSHVISAIGVNHNDVKSVVRFSLGRDTTKKDIDNAVDALIKIVNKLRSMSVPYKQYMAANKLK